MKKLILPFLLIFCTFKSQLSAVPEEPFDEKQWMIRGRVIHIAPNEKSRPADNLGGSGISCSHATMPEIDFTFFITRYVGVEVSLTTAQLSLKGEGSLSEHHIGRTWIFPPCFMAQYHFNPCGTLRPYVGFGVNYTVFYDIDPKIERTNLDLTDSVRVAYQAGCDYFFDNNWFINIDVKYVPIETFAKLTGVISGNIHLDLDPWIVGIGISKKF